MTWDGVVTKYHKRHIKELEIQPNLESYIQSLVLKKTLESISLERRRGHDWSEAGEDKIGDSVNKMLIQKPYEGNIIEEAKPKRFENKMSLNDKSKEKHGEKQIVNLNGKNINVN